MRIQKYEKGVLKKISYLFNLKIKNLFCIFAPTILRGYGEIGRHARLRIWCRKACRFESYYPHEKSFSIEKLFLCLCLNHFLNRMLFLIFKLIFYL